VLLCHDYQNGIKDEDEDIIFAIELITTLALGL
jgi:hypothetical protein